jgi:hypothetical protein
MYIFPSNMFYFSVSTRHYSMGLVKATPWRRQTSHQYRGAVISPQTRISAVLGCHNAKPIPHTCPAKRYGGLEKYKTCDKYAAGELKRKVVSKKVAAERASMIKKFDQTPIKAQISVYESHLKLSEHTLSFNVALSASLATLEEVLPCFLFSSYQQI